MKSSLNLSFLVLLTLTATTKGFIPSHRPVSSTRVLGSSTNDAEGAENLKRKAEELRDQIRSMEEQLGDSRKRSYDLPKQPQPEPVPEGMTLDGKRVLVAGANGRLGSMVCRYLLRNYPKTEVVAAVHYVGENSPTARGYGRLSYEVGAEDGVGSIGPAWSSEDRTATFEWDESMRDYNLQNLRVVECEFLDPVQCMSVAEGCDAVVWCATDFNGNQPRAISGLNVAFLFRAVSRPTKGRVDVEGLENMLGALKTAKQDKLRKNPNSANNDPINFVLVSTAPDAFEDFETPFGSFYGIKKQGEGIVKQNFPSLSHTVLQLGRFDDNFVEENLDIQLAEALEADSSEGSKDRRLINRRDAARAVVDALLDEKVAGKTFQVWTAKR